MLIGFVGKARHSKEELKLIPKSSLYKTKLCINFKKGICPFGVKCKYIHFQKNKYELFLIKFMTLTYISVCVFGSIKFQEAGVIPVKQKKRKEMFR